MNTEFLATESGDICFICLLHSAYLAVATLYIKEQIPICGRFSSD